MKVLYDITTLAHIHCAPGVQPAGIVRHTEEMGLALARRPELDFFVSVAASQFPKAARYLTDTETFGLDRLAVPTLGDSGVSESALSSLHPGRTDGGLLQPRLSDYVAGAYSPERIYNAGRYDVYHVNWRGETALPDQAYPTVVLTVPDVIAVKHPEWFVRPGEPNPIGDYVSALLISVRRHHAVTVSTDTVKQDVLELFPNISAEQVHVTPLGVSDRFVRCDDKERLDAVRQRYGIPDGHRYVLCVNTMEPRKNMTAALDAYAKLVADGAADDVSLVLAGSKGWLSDDLEAHCAEVAGSGRASIIAAGYVDDADMAPLYSGASLFCYPSLDEGFGLPVLEAMRCGTPVITSDRPALLEAAGEAALTVDPHDASGLAMAMSHVLDDPERAAEMRAKGAERASRYTWDRSAAAMVTAYERASDARSFQRAARGIGRRPSRDEYRVAARRRTVPLGPTSLGELEGMYRGERLFIVGDAFDPATAPVGPLADELTFAINHFHRHRDRIRWKPTFYAVTADAIDEQSAPVINGLTGSAFFFEDRTADLLRVGPDVIPFRFDAASPRVSGTGLFDTVAIPAVSGPERSLVAAMQIAHHLGFESVYLVGAEPNDGEVEAIADTHAWHAACRDAFVAAGRQIASLSAATSSEIYRRADPHRMFASPVLPEFSRGQHAHVEETAVIATMIAERRGGPRTMIDVGAHRGTSAIYFVNRNWTIHCYEPDATNRDHLTRRYGDRPNLTIDARAVGAEPATGVPFYTSEESGAISGLSAFRETHQLDGYVDVTTVAEITDQHQIDHVDFLKIDVEGFDLDVLKGVPWDRIRPDVIECEYEDAKTIPMGHTVRDIAEYLRARDYTVYVSEWHPVIRYGMRHDWRRVVPYPGFDVPSDSWGNLLAFKHDPGYEAVQAALAAQVNVNGVPLQPRPKRAGTAGSVRTSGAARGNSQPKRRFYAATADGLRSRAPGVYAPLRFVKRAVVTMWNRYRSAAIAGVATVLALVVAGAVVQRPAWRYAIWTSTALMLLGAAIVAVAMYAYRSARKQSALGAQLPAVRRRLDALAARADARMAGLEGRVERLPRLPSGLASSVHELQRSVNQIEALQHRVTAAEATGHAYGAQLEAEREQIIHLQELAADLQQTLAQLRSSTDASVAGVSERLSVLESSGTAQSSFSNYSNAAKIRMHSRLLTDDDVDELQTRWLRHFGLSLSDRELRYLAHKICLDEERCEGRLGTTIQAAMLRSLALLSLRSDSIELLEIGTLNGIGAGSLYRVAARARRSVKLTLIDPLTGYYESSVTDRQTGVPITMETLVDNLDALRVPEPDYRIIQLLSTDPEARSKAADRQYDYVLIDGDHSLQGVSGDFELYGPLVRPGGLLLFDDYDTTDWPAIKPYVDEHVRPHDDWLWIGGGWRTAILKKKQPAA